MILGLDFNVIAPVTITTLGMVATAWLGTRNKGKLLLVQSTVATLTEKVAYLERENIAMREKLDECEHRNLMYLERIAELAKRE